MRLENVFISLLAEPQFGDSWVLILKATDPIGELLYQRQTFRGSGNNSPFVLERKR